MIGKEKVGNFWAEGWHKNARKQGSFVQIKMVNVTRRKVEQCD